MNFNVTHLKFTFEISGLAMLFSDPKILLLKFWAGKKILCSEEDKLRNNNDTSMILAVTYIHGE